MSAKSVLLALFAAAALCSVDARGLRAKKSIGSTRLRDKVAQGKVRGGSTATMNGILVFTRFNCAFPFCPTTALDVCSADEHYEFNRPYVLATLIPQTTTAEMNFYAFSDFDNSTRMHYTLAARPNQVQLFTVNIAMNGTAGTLMNSVNVNLPSTVDVTTVTYLFTYNSLVYVSFVDGTLLTLSPSTGAILNTTAMVPPSSGLVDSLAGTLDRTTGIFYMNAQGAGGFYLHTYNVITGNTTVLGPLPAAPGTAGPGGVRVDNAIGSMAVYPPASVGGPLRLLEWRESNDAPFEFLAWLDPVTGNSTQLSMPDEWYDNWDIDPNYFPDQWPGSKRRVWSYDPQNSIAWFKLYDECGGQTDDCDENECVVYLEWMPGDYVDFYVAVEPIEPELTQLTWVWTNVVN